MRDLAMAAGLVDGAITIMLLLIAIVEALIFHEPETAKLVCAIAAAVNLLFLLTALVALMLQSGA